MENRGYGGIWVKDQKSKHKILSMQNLNDKIYSKKLKMSNILKIRVQKMLSFWGRELHLIFAVDLIVWILHFTIDLW